MGRFPYRTPPDPRSPYFRSQLAAAESQHTQNEIGGFAGPGEVNAGMQYFDTTPPPTCLYRITDSDGYGRYAGVRVYHKREDSPGATSPPPPPPPPLDSFVDDPGGFVGRDCDLVEFPLVEVNLVATVMNDTIVNAWPSPHQDAMVFVAASPAAVSTSVVVIKVTGATAVGGSASLDYLWASQLTDINGSYAWVDSGSSGDIYTRFIEPVQPATGRRYLALLSSQTYTGKPVYIAMSRYVDVECAGDGSITLSE